MDDESSVRVAVRIRPQLPREKIDMCRVCTNVTPGEPQVTLGSDKAFTYDYVFDMESSQDDIYSKCAESLVAGSLEGYNATVLAYGQTGSGKTYTMGTGFDINVPSEQTGIIPRAIEQIFDGIQRLTDSSLELGQTPPQFKVSAQFLELYNDEVIDLFDPTLDYSTGKGKSGIKIHQDSNNTIYVTGVTSERVNSAAEAMKLLKQGALSRTTASTQMNAQSSRSHAIFTLHIKQQRLVKLEMDGDEIDTEGEKGQEFETLTAKFHFVDLAGSERLKRTGATGDRAKEGISINCGLLALGNVISALGDISKKALHVPYRDSKLTRLLQDSLGGNSRTLMIACISPSDQDFMETLNTLKYANRARNIQNKVMINQDKSSRTISLLKREIQELRLELLDYKQGKRIVSEDGTEMVNDMFHENNLLQTENDNLRMRVKGMQDTIDSLSAKTAELLAEKASSATWINGNTADGGEMKEMIKGYLTEIESLRAQLLESESLCTQLRKNLSRKSVMSPRHDSFSDPNIDSILDLAKKEVEKDLESVARSQITMEGQSDQSGSESESETTEENEVIHEQYSSELATLNSEISMKQRLIEELERAQRKLVNMKTHYEDKLIQLERKIQATEVERDQVLASYGETKQPSDKVKKVKDEYEKRIQGMQREMKELHSAKKEHAKLLRNQNQYQNQLRTLNNEVSDMKRTKVKLMNKMREEAQKHKEETLQSTRKIAQLTKKTRQDANLIRNLEAEKRLKSAVLKRKQEEVTALKRAALRTARTRLGVNNNNQVTKYAKSPKVAKAKWLNLERNFCQNTMLRESIASLEKQMEREIEKRAELQEELRNKSAQIEDERYGNSSVLKEELDSIKTSLEHVQTTITELQHEILQVEENMTTLDSGEVLQGIKSVADASYITDKLYNFALHQSMMRAKAEEEQKALMAKLDLLERDSKTQTDLLQHMILKEKNVQIGTTGRTSPVNHHHNIESNNSSRSTSPTDNIQLILPKPATRTRKKLTMTTDELLYSVPPSQGSVTALPSPELMQPPPLTRSFTTVKVASVPSSPALIRKGLTLSPRANRKPFVLSNHPSMERLDKSPPGSPPVYRRQTSREENVFSRLTQQQLNNSNRLPGKITAHIPKKIGKTPLICTHTAEGHSRAVLALCATEDLLFTASQDRNVIQWDLNEMREVNVFGNHPNNVVSVKYDPSRRIMYSASNSFVKIWDTRDSKCIKTLTSSGLTANFSSNNFNSSEPQINDIALNTRNLVLYSAAGDKVRVWDLRKFGVVGKLTGGHQAAIMCIATSKGHNHSEVVYTGSKDHYIKVFDVPLGAVVGTLTPRVTLEPPHYDGIQCLVTCGSSIFSGSRDCIIKKWTNDELVTSVNLAHKDWVTGLCLFQGSTVLASSCRDGTVKLWSTDDSCNLLGELKAHSSPINAITSNSNFLFTASSDYKLKMWTVNSRWISEL